LIHGERWQLWQTIQAEMMSLSPHIEHAEWHV
jgi:hypothetical protein